MITPDEIMAWTGTAGRLRRFWPRRGPGGLGVALALGASGAVLYWHAIGAPLLLVAAGALGAASSLVSLNLRRPGRRLGTGLSVLAPDQFGPVTIQAPRASSLAAASEHCMDAA